MKSIKCWKILLLLSLMVVLGGCSLFKTKINLGDYISYAYEGINGYTSILVTLDTERIRTDFGEEISEKKLQSFNSLLEGITVTSSKTDNLCNGDIVTIHVSYDETACEDAGIQFSGNDMEIIIEGLEEGILLDLFADITVNVKGTAPLAQASIENKSTNEFIRGLTYTLDRTTGFGPGEELVVTCNIDEQAAKEQGYVYLYNTRTYKTDGIDVYVKQGTDLDINVLTEIVLEAKNTVISETEGSQTRMLYKVTESSNFLFQYNKEWIDSIELYEIKFLTAGDVLQVKEQNAPYNKLYVVFKAYVTNADHGSDGYFCFAYDNIIKKGDGSLFVKHDNQNLRYLCNDDYDELMAEVQKMQAIPYTENVIDINQITIVE